MKKIYLALICMLCVYAVSAQSVSLYSFTESAGSYAALGGTNSTATGDDGTQNGIPIGFNFNYGGTVYTQFCITTNGFIKLGNAGVTITTGTPNYTNSFSNSTTNSPLIAPFWDDNNRGGGAITYAVSGIPGSQVLSVDWNAVNIGGSGATSGTNLASYRVNLYEGSNIIELVYGTMGAAGTLSGSIGLNDNTSYLSVTPGSPSTASSAAANNGISSTTNVTGKKFTFMPPPPCIGTPAPGNTISSGASSCTGGSVTLSLQNPTPGAGVAYQWYSSLDGITYSTIAGANGPTYTAVITANTYFKADVTCTAGPATGTSNPVLVSLNTLCTYSTNYTPGITYNSISATGSSATFQTTSGDDNTTTNITLPFGFVFKGTTYNIVNACTNGWLAFGGTTATSYINTLSSSSNGAPAMLAPLWDDLVATGQAAANLPTSFKYQTLGTAPNRVFVAEWIGLETFNNAGPNINFQVKLYEGTNRIEYVYGTMEGYNGTGSSVLYSYSLGLRANATDYISLQKDNTNFFSTAAANDGLNVLPACNSMYSFDPSGAFTTGTDPGSPAPVNDDPAGAVTIAVNGTPCSSYCGTYYKTANATASAGIGTCSAATPGTADDDVWFKFTATNAVQNVSVFGGGGYDAVVQAFSDAGITSIGCVNATTGGATETLGLTGLTVGATYYVRVYHAATGNGTTPQISICISAPPPPPANDDPCGAVVLTPTTTCTPYSDNSTNSTTSVTAATTTTQSSAGNLIAAPTCTGAGAAVSDVWFKFIATGDRHGITITPVPGFDVAVQAFTPTGTCAGGNLALTAIGCVNGASTGTAESVVITTTIGSEYYLRVYRHPSGIAGAPVNNSQFSICIYNPTPLCTTNITPADLATGVSATPTLTFNRVNFASSYDVYLGTTVASATLQGNVADPGTGTTASFSIVTALAPNTQYFWYITPKNSNGSASGCSAANATSFTTSSVVPPGCVTNISPADGSTGLSSPVNLTWNPDATATSYDVYLGTTNPPTTTIATGVAATNYSWTGAAGSTTYYWYISPKNAGGSASGCSSNTTSFSTAAFACTPVYGTQVCDGLGGDSISIFHLQGETVSLDNNSGGYCGDAGTPSYGQYLALPQPDMAAGKAYTGAMTTNPIYDEYASIWIDFNDDQNFTANERVLSGLFLPAATTSPFSIYIAPGSLTGAHRMRVRITETSGAIDPCTSLSYGEAEDYMVNIISGPGSPYTISGDGAGACADMAITTIDAASNNNNSTVPILDESGRIIAMLTPNGNNLGQIGAGLYINTGSVRQVGTGTYYLDRNIAVTPSTQPTSNVGVRLYFTAAELAALQAVDPSVTGPAALNVTKQTGTCASSYTPTGVFLPQTGSGSYGSDYYIDVNTPSFSDFFIAGGNVVLPVTIQYLTGSKQGTANYLDWKINCTSAPAVDIALERSADGRKFNPIQTQNATATRCLQDFNYTDASPLSGINYYRVKITTPDGAFKYSVIVALLNKDKGFELISVAPNPVQSSTVLSVTSVKGGRLDIAVSDVTGRIVMKQTVTTIAGNTAVNMDFTKLGAGTYQITAVDADGEKKTTQFVKF